MKLTALRSCFPLTALRSCLPLLRTRLATAVITALVLSALPQRAAPQLASSGIVFSIDPAQSKVHWTLGSTLNTVYGSFSLEKGTLQLDPQTAKASASNLTSR